jgi:hypothetical protein
MPASAVALALLAQLSFPAAPAPEWSAAGSTATSSRAARGSSCGYWRWCKHGTKQWDGKTCSCDPGFSGKCCTKTVPCSADADFVCPSGRYEAKTARCADVTAGSPLFAASSNLPDSLRGVFWLTQQADSSALWSFGAAPGSLDGGGLNQGKLIAGDYNIEIRVMGDRTWSFHDRSSGWNAASFLDLVYKFKFDNIAAPTSAQIIPESRTLGITLTWTTLLDFDMHLLPDDEKPERYRGTDVVVWGRVSSSFGQQIDSAYYDLVQVIDGDGAKTAAFDDWVAYCESDVTGGNPGEMHYRQVKEGFRG